MSPLQGWTRTPGAPSGTCCWNIVQVTLPPAGRRKLIQSWCDATPVVAGTPNLFKINSVSQITREISCWIMLIVTLNNNIIARKQLLSLQIKQPCIEVSCWKKVVYISCAEKTNKQKKSSFPASLFVYSKFLFFPVLQGAQSLCPPTTWMRQICWATGWPSSLKDASTAAAPPSSSRTALVLVSIWLLYDESNMKFQRWELICLPGRT